MNASNALMLAEAIRRERYAAFADQPRAGRHERPATPLQAFGAIRWALRPLNITRRRAVHPAT